MNYLQEEKERSLKEKNDILQSTMESYKDVLIFSIDREYRYLVFNTAFKQATLQAYGTEVKEGMNMLDSFTNPADRERAKNNCDRTFEGQPLVTTEVYGEQELFYFETRYSPIINNKSEVAGVTVMSSNITERKKSEEQLLALNKELEAFAYSVSHDLRTPLRAINGHSAILMEDHTAELSEEGRSSVAAIGRNSKRMGDLIDDLLAFSRLGRREVVKMEVNMKSLVGSVLDEIQYQESKASMKIGNLPPAFGDATLIRQIWVNLISNAYKYSKNHPSPEIEIGSINDPNGIVFYVKDNGVGFEMNYYDKLFGVFQRLHGESEFEGTGVGLAIIKKIIDRHNGKVWAESKLNEGATFFFSLPVDKN